MQAGLSRRSGKVSRVHTTENCDNRFTDCLEASPRSTRECAFKWMVNLYAVCVLSKVWLLD